jgi:hypothetical protein
MYSDRAGPQGRPMPQTQSALSSSVAQAHLSRDGAKRRREHLRHIYRMTHEQQIALVEEARAARAREQQAQSGSSAQGV